ncbi:MAG: helix-turn-helix transcriptional regulator [Robiginitomaculum sp.]|nr:helix-turn-helix transcriptional regulator [Robiginitomaculum sp.]
MKIENLTPNNAILQELGTRLARIRKQQGYSQLRLANEAGIGVATLRRIEAGHDSQMETWLKLMKSLQMITAIDDLLPKNYSSPMAEALSNRRTRKKKNDAPSGSIWGDEKR